MKTKLTSNLILALLISAVFLFICTAWAQETGFRRGAASNQPVDMSLTSIAGQDRVVMLEGKTYLNGYAGYGQPRRGGRGGMGGGRRRGPHRIDNGWTSRCRSRRCLIPPRRRSSSPGRRGGTWSGSSSGCRPPSPQNPCSPFP